MTKAKIPKRKPNYFFIYNKDKNEYNEIKYLTQYEIMEGWTQIIPHTNNNNLINHFSVTLAYLPDNLWPKLVKKNNSFDIVKHGLTRYTIAETNQDSIMIDLYNEIHKKIPDRNKLQKLIDELDESQYSSWLVLRSKAFIKRI